MDALDKKDVKPGKIGAVMVVGAGISGMQSALDLANSGFKVYLVEETSAIGGRMSQLDKTFPTNDCAMCMISPRLIEVDKHPNIEVITSASVQSVEGEEGNFRVRVLKNPRYVDEDKCRACGDCVEACPVTLKNEFEQGLSSRKAVYKRYPQAIPNALAITKGARPPCKLTCPAGCNGQGYLALISQGKYVEAYNHIKQWIPLPGVLGRICHHPCEAKCNRGQVDEPLSMASLKRFVADAVSKEKLKCLVQAAQKPVVDYAKAKVAIIGAGPSGITCALDLIKKGYPVTVFEASSRPGGQLQSAIPAYRLPKDILMAEIGEVANMGVDLRLNTPIGGKFSLSDLKAQGYRAIYLAVGAQKSRSLPVPGVSLPGVLLALDFLRKVNQGHDPGIGKRVVVIGGGNVAIDAARTARRLGAEVSLVCLESRPEMPAHPWEIAEAEEEGVSIKTSWGPTKMVDQEGRVSAVEFQRCTAIFNDKGAFAPSFDSAVTTRLACDTVVIAIGQSVDLSFLPQETAVKVGRSSFITVDPVTLATDEPGVFAGGDAVTGPKSAVEAIGHGHEAAISIDRYLSGADPRQGRKKPMEEPAPLPEGKHDIKKRLPLKKIPIDRRLSSFDEITVGYTEEEAKAEAKRCLNCGLCSECLQFVSVCKANAIDHGMQKEVVELAVGSVILAPGFEPFDARSKGEYGYGRMPNVVSSLEFERILSASGPFRGEVRRPSDGEHPKKIAWIQCVGSRDTTCGREYCSSVCCMHATKEAIIAREHNSDIQPTIFYNDLRAFGKGFERYYELARKKFGVRYVKSMISTVKEMQRSKNLLLEYVSEDGERTAEEFDMVVLSVGLAPSTSARDLAKRLNVATDKFGFGQTDEFQPNVTSRPGIYVAGAFESPMDIPESVMSASSAACVASQHIAEARGTMLREKVYPPEMALSMAQHPASASSSAVAALISDVWLMWPDWSNMPVGFPTWYTPRRIFTRALPIPRTK